MRVNKIEIETLIDSGAFASLIDENYIKILKIENKYIWPDVTTLFDVNKREIETKGRVHLLINLFGVDLLQEFNIVTGLSRDCILGRDAMARHGIVVNGRKMTVYLEDDEGSICNERPINRPGKSEYSLSMDVTVPKNKKRVMTKLNAELNQGTIKKSIKFEPGSSRFVSARLSQPLQEDTACYAIAADDLPEELYIQEALVLVNEKNEIDIHVSNRSDQTIQLMRKTVVTHVEPVDVCALGSNDAAKIKDGCRINHFCTVDGSMPNDTKYFEKFTLDQDSKELKKTLRKCKDIFVDKGEPTGRTNIKYCVCSMVLLVLMVLVGCANAFKMTVCNCTTNELKTILRTDKLDCEKMNDAEIRTEPVSIALENNVDYISCIDYRRLKELTQTNPLIFPCMNAVLDKLRFESYFTTLQTARTKVENDKQKTALIVKNYLYHTHDIPPINYMLNKLINEKCPSKNYLFQRKLPSYNIHCKFKRKRKKKEKERKRNKKKKKRKRKKKEKERKRKKEKERKRKKKKKEQTKNLSR